MELEPAAAATSFDTVTYEIARLAWLRSYHILDTGRDVVFDRLVSSAAQIFRAPAAGIAFLDTDRLWFKAELGLDLDESPGNENAGNDRSGRIGPCIHAILSRHVLVVEDTARDARFGLQSFVTGAPFYRFYAGAPLFAPAGLRLGTLCVLDYQPRTASVQDVSSLCDLAQDVMRALERRRCRVRQRPPPSRRRAA